MKFTLPSLLAVAVLAGLLHQPQPVYGQSKEIGALQRDIYDLSRKIDELKGGQAEKSAQMETLLKQVMDANAALTAELKSIQDATRKTQTDQQSLVISPLNKLSLSVDDTSASVAGIQGDLGALRKSQERLEGTLSDLSSAMKLVLKQTEQAQPQAPAVSAAPSPSDAAAMLFASGQTDRLAGKPNFALKTFGDLAQKYPDTPYAPMAMFEIGAIYTANGEYGEALKAFDRVIEQFSDNPMRKDAQFQKAEQLANLGRKNDAIKEFNAFAKQYPSDDKAADALSRVRELNAPANTKAKQPARPKAKSK
ncbi:MAG: tetratricopeptide repeat protein [Bryobacteraceae bacterium]